jgi:chaperonin GroEL
MPKIMLHDEAARAALGRGVAKLAKAVRGTLGPKGMNAIMDRPIGTPIISRDGLSIASEIERMPFENGRAGAARGFKADQRVAGDGTTTATVQPTCLCRTQGARRRRQPGRTGRRAWLAAVTETIALKRSAKALQGPADLRAVASIAANDAALGNGSGSLGEPAITDCRSGIWQAG